MAHNMCCTTLGKTIHSDATKARCLIFGNIKKVWGPLFKITLPLLLNAAVKHNGKATSKALNHSTTTQKLGEKFSGSH